MITPFLLRWWLWLLVLSCAWLQPTTHPERQFSSILCWKVFSVSALSFRHLPIHFIVAIAGCMDFLCTHRHTYRRPHHHRQKEHERAPHRVRTSTRKSASERKKGSYTHKNTHSEETQKFKLQFSIIQRHVLIYTYVDFRMMQLSCWDRMFESILVAHVALLLLLAFVSYICQFRVRVDPFRTSCILRNDEQNCDGTDKLECMANAILSICNAHAKNP